MDLKNQIIQEYLTQGCGLRTLEKKYGFSRTTISRWVQIYQGIQQSGQAQNQQKYYIRVMENSKKKATSKQQPTVDELQEKIALLEKQLNWEKLRADALDTMINIAEKQLNVPIRKKPGSPQSEK